MGIVEPIKPPRTSDPKEADKFFQEIALRNSYQTYAGIPTGVVTPRWTGDMVLDTTNADWYKSTGATSADWKVMT